MCSAGVGLLRRADGRVEVAHEYARHAKSGANMMAFVADIEASCASGTTQRLAGRWYFEAGFAQAFHESLDELRLHGPCSIGGARILGIIGLDFE